MKRLLVFHLLSFVVLIPADNLLHAETLSRPEAISIALETNPDVIEAEHEWGAALARVKQERAFPDPEFEIEFEGLPDTRNLGDYGEKNIGFVQQFEYPMKWHYRVKSARHSAEATKLASYEKMKLEIAGNVKTAYDRVLANRKILEYEELNLILINDFYEKAQVRYEMGDVSQLDILRAGVELGRSKNRVTRARSNLAVSRAELNALLLRDSDLPLQLSEELTYNRIAIERSELIKMALEQRPDLRGAALTIESLEANKSEKKASIFPDITVGMFRQTVAEPLESKRFWRFSFALEIPLWAWYRQRGSIQEASAEIRQAVSHRASLQSQILLEVDSALHEFTAAREQMDLFNESVMSLAEQSYEIAVQSYEQGRATYLELMDAQKALIETNIEYTETLFNYRVTVIELERSIGKDIESVEQKSGGQ